MIALECRRHELNVVPRGQKVVTVGVLQEVVRGDKFRAWKFSVMLGHAESLAHKVALAETG